MNLSFINTLRQYLKNLNEEPLHELALGVTLGMFVGLLPLSINSVIIAFFLFVLKTDKTSGVLSAILFGLISTITDPLAHVLGYFVLAQLTFLTPLWTALYNVPFMAFTGFNNTIVMGNTLLGLILMVPVFKASIRLLTKYRALPFASWSVQYLAENKKISGLFGAFKGFNLFDRIKGQQ
jgi:uncharacterized protein (TIGR03546 family)